MVRCLALSFLCCGLLGCKGTSPWHPKHEPIQVAERLVSSRSPVSSSHLPTVPIESLACGEPHSSELSYVAPANATVEALTSDPVEAMTPSISNKPYEASASTETVQTIDLPTALALTIGNNPRIQLAQERIRESTAQWERASLVKLPSIRAGVNYNKHEGRIQDVAGQVIETSRGSFYSGLGANAVGAGSPAVPGIVAQFHMADAVFAPRIAQQTTAARRWGAKSTENDQLLETALAYTELLRAEQALAAFRDLIQRYKELVRVTGDFARVGEGLESDFERAKTELALREIHALRCEEQVSIASARLTELVRWDQEMRLVPSEHQLIPLELSDLAQSPQSMIAMALSQRPELAQSKHLVCEAVERYRREEKAPLVPSVLLATSYGGLGGGLGSDLTNYGDRFDFDAVAYWEVRQLGLGEKAARREANSRIHQAKITQIQTMDQIAREVSEAFSQVKSRKKQIALAEQAVVLAESSFEKNWERIQNAKGLPIEVLQSIDAWNTARQEYISTVANYNVAQFRLQRAIGWPVSSTVSPDE
jgi:outer membrane protein TolC